VSIDYCGRNPLALITAYDDADLGSEMDDRTSITGFVLQMNGCTYADKSHHQSIVHDDT
jgi:hypothetical protein